MPLSVSNLLTHYVVHPQAPELNIQEQSVAWISSITLGVLTLGLLHLSVAVREEGFKNRNLTRSWPSELTAPWKKDQAKAGSIFKTFMKSNDQPFHAQKMGFSSFPNPHHLNSPFSNTQQRSNTLSQASFSEPRRLLLLDGDDGTVACRIHGPLMSATIPRKTDNGTLESATRSLLRMNNLAAIRGTPGASMVGPIDYLGNLEEPHRYLYTIQNGSPPVCYRKPITAATVEESSNLQPFDNSVATTVNAHWISGRDGSSIREKQEEYHVTPRHLRQSLFLDPGLLEIDRQRIELRYFDPRGVDLSSFKARVVDNTIPFRITERQLPSKDDYRMVTYLYEPGYADWQVENGSGLFLEKHDFSQTITPIAPNSKGFVTLARTNEHSNELELIGIQIPYGHTLIIEEGCIHGDTTLNGLFMMGMTSDHTTMGTADTVFLKYPGTKKNVSMAMVTPEEELSAPAPTTNLAPNPPYVVYQNATASDRQGFRRLTQGQNFVFNPFSKEYWNYLKGV